MVFKTVLKTLERIKKVINLFENLFNINPEVVETALRIKIIEFQMNNSVKKKFNYNLSSKNHVEFYSNISKEDLPNVNQFAANMSCIYYVQYIFVCKYFQL